MSSLFSESWYRVAQLRPRLRPHAHIHRHSYRDGIWYVLQDHSTGKFHRFTPVANSLISQLDGRRTMQEVWDGACARLGDEVPSQDDVIKLLSDLHQADVLLSNAGPDLAEQHQRRRKHRKTRLRQYFSNPMSLRFPLLDPDRFLQRCMPWFRRLYGWPGLLLWLATLAGAASLAGMHWRELSHDMLDQVFSLDNFLLLWIAFPLVKLLHELGHALVTKVNGGEVHELGIMLLILMPTPYVDSSSAAAFQSKRQRMLVGASGMMVELFLAALAMFAWVYLEPGPARAIAYNVMLIAGVSAVIFNGNPLLRYDGYYILSDYLEIPNLGQRANEYLNYLVNHRLFGVRKMTSPVTAAGEPQWFVFYAIASFLYRMFVTVSIVLIVASQFFIVGVAMAIWTLVTAIVLPVAKKLHYLVASPRLRTQRTRAIVSSAAIAAILGACLLVVPTPYSTMAEGVIWAPEQSQVRSRVDGFLVSVDAAQDAPVRKGQLLLTCADPELEAQQRVLEAQLTEMGARYNMLILTSKVQASMVQEQIAQASDALAQARRRQADLAVRSPADGRFVMQDAGNAPGRFVQRGEVLAYVLDQHATTVRVVVRQADADLVRQQTTGVEVRPVDQPGRVIHAAIERIVPGATDELPSMTLALQGGGKVGLDPARSGEMRSLEKLFVLDLRLPPGAQRNLLGSRMYVRFSHQPVPAGQQLYRMVRRIFLKKFNV